MAKRNLCKPIETAPNDLVERLRALHVWPQFVADEHVCDLRSKQIEGLYGVGTVAHEAADRIETLIAERDAALAKLAAAKAHKVPVILRDGNG